MSVDRASCAIIIVHLRIFIVPNFTNTIMIVHLNTNTHKPFNPIDVTDGYDLDEDDEEQGEVGSVVVEHGEPVIPRGGGEAQAEQQAEDTH